MHGSPFEWLFLYSYRVTHEEAGASNDWKVARLKSDEMEKRMGRERKMTTASDTPVTRLVRSYIIYPCRGHNIYIYLSQERERKRKRSTCPDGTNRYKREERDLCRELWECYEGWWIPPPSENGFLFLSFQSLFFTIIILWDDGSRKCQWVKRTTVASYQSCSRPRRVPSLLTIWHRRHVEYVLRASLVGADSISRVNLSERLVSRKLTEIRPRVDTRSTVLHQYFYFLILTKFGATYNKYNRNYIIHAEDDILMRPERKREILFQEIFVHGGLYLTNKFISSNTNWMKIYTRVEYNNW